jgi:hypothetical protein
LRTHGEWQEAFFEGHMHTFSVLGGVPTGKVRYDNLSSAVARVLGFTRARVENERWVAFRSHSPLTELLGGFSHFRDMWLRWLRSLPMIGDEDSPLDLAALVVSAAGALRATGDPWEPYRLVDAEEPVVAVAGFFRDLQAAGLAEATMRSYGMDLLRWFRFLWAIGTPWSRATRRLGRRGGLEPAVEKAGT